jgi:hypothetical protein
VTHLTDLFSSVIIEAKKKKGRDSCFGVAFFCLIFCLCISVCICICMCMYVCMYVCVCFYHHGILRSMQSHVVTLSVQAPMRFNVMAAAVGSMIQEPQLVLFSPFSSSSSSSSFLFYLFCQT